MYVFQQALFCKIVEGDHVSHTLGMIGYEVTWFLGSLVQRVHASLKTTCNTKKKASSTTASIPAGWYLVNVSGEDET